MAGESKMVIFKDDQDEYRFRLVGSNGETIAQSEGYSAKQSITTLHAVYFWAFKLVDETGE